MSSSRGSSAGYASGWMICSVVVGSARNAPSTASLPAAVRERLHEHGPLDVRPVLELVHELGNTLGRVVTAARWASASRSKSKSCPVPSAASTPW